MQPYIQNGMNESYIYDKKKTNLSRTNISVLYCY